jgi:transposase
VSNDAESLPSDLAAAQAIILAERAARLESEARAAQIEADLSHSKAAASSADALIARLKLEIERLRRALYGVRSERKQRLLDQLEMHLEDAEADATEDELAAERSAPSTVVKAFARRRPVRKPFPEHLPRERVVIAAPASCPCCGSTKLSKLGEDVTETLEVVPCQWKVIQTVRERFSCRQCETISQPPAPFHVTPRGFAGPNLLAMVLFEKFGQHQPLNRQSERYAREGIDLGLSTLADQVGACATALRPLHALIERHVFAAERLHGDDTTVPILAKGHTQTGRIWVYVRDDQPFGGKDLPAALFYASRDRTREHPERHLAGWSGVLQADAYGGYNRLYLADREPGPIVEALCWSHARRKFFELADIAANVRRGKNAAPISPIALEAVRRIDAVFDVERDVNGQSGDERLRVRREVAADLVAALEAWMRVERARLSRHAAVAKAIDYMLTRWPAFARFLDDGRICLTTDGVEKRKSSTRRGGAGRRLGFGRFLLPRRHHSLVGLLGACDGLGFPLADLLDPVVATWPRFAIFAGSARLERSFAQLHRGEGRTCIGVLGPVRQNAPDHRRELSRCRHGRRGRPTSAPDAFEKCPQWTRRELCRPRRLDEHFASVRISLLADPSVTRGVVSGLADLRSQSEVAAQLFRRRESRDVADRCQDRRRDDRPDPGDRHQANCVGVFQCSAHDRLVEKGELLRIALQFVDQSADDPSFLVGQRQALQPNLAGFAEQMPRVPRDQIRMQNCVEPPLRANHLFENTHAFGGLTAPPLGVVVCDPDLRQKAAGVQSGQYGCVDFVGLHPSVGDRPYHAWIGHDYALDERSQDPLDSSAVAGRFDDDFVFSRKRSCELDEAIMNQIDPLLPLDLPVLQERRLRERAMYVHADDRHDSSHLFFGSQRACTTSTDPRSQRNRASRRGGQVTTRARSSWS